MTPKQFWKAQSEWSQKTFGTDAERGPIGALKHLEKEAREAYTEENWHKRAMEIVDCLFLTYDAARRHGISFDELYQFAEEKLAINKARQWGPRTAGDEPIEHIRTS